MTKEKKVPEQKEKRIKPKPVKKWSQAVAIQAESWPVLLQRTGTTIGSAPPKDADYLQRTIGNQAIGQMVANQDALTPAVDTTHYSLHQMLTSQAQARGGRPIVQAKLTLGSVGDKYEQEADSVAKQVVNNLGQPPVVQREEDEDMAQPKSLLQRREDENMKMTLPSTIASLQRQEDEDVQAKGEPMFVGGELTGDVETAVTQAKSGGQSMSENIRVPMEQAFDADFSNVKIHADSQADRLNRSLNARAFTSGQDIFFRQGEHDPGSSTGQELLAHELTHVVQQSGGAVQRSPQTQISQSSPANISTIAPIVIQRADWYEYGAANVTPHIHAYGSGDCHLKDAYGHRYDLIQKGRRVKQQRINEAYDAIREQYPDPNNAVRVAVLAKMSELLRVSPKDKGDE